MKEFSDLLHFAIWAILHDVFITTIKYCFYIFHWCQKILTVIQLMRNTLQPRIEERNILNTAVFLFSRIFEWHDATWGYKIRNSRKVSANVPSRFISALPRAILASRMQNANPDDKLADRQWFSSYNSISPEFSLFFDIIQRECNFQ